MKKIILFAMMIGFSFSANSQPIKKYVATHSYDKLIPNDSLIIYEYQYGFQDGLGNKISFQTYPKRGIIVSGDTVAIFKYLFDTICRQDSIIRSQKPKKK